MPRLLLVSRSARDAAVALSLTTLAALAAACAAPPMPATVAPAPDVVMPEPPPPAPAYAYTIGPDRVRAVRFQPEALASLEWPTPPPPRSLDAQRRRVTSAKGAARSKEVQELATLLWYAEPPDSDAARPYQEEARGLLREHAATGSAPESLLVMLTIAERSLADDAAAAAVYDQMILRFPASPQAWRYRAVRAWLALRADDVRKAAEIVAGVDLGARATPPAIHYVVGWIAFRRGELATAHAELAVAAQGWSDLESWDVLRHELYMVSALADARADYIVQLMEGLLAGPPGRKGGLTYVRVRLVKDRGKTVMVNEERVLSYSREWELVDIGRALWYAGRDVDARAVLERALGGDPLAAAAAGSTLVAIADATQGPAEAAARAEEAVLALARAETDPRAGDVVAVREDLSTRVRTLGDSYTGLWSVTGSTDHAAAARRLYAAYATLPGRADAPVVAARAAALDTARPAAPPTVEAYRTLVIDPALASQRPQIVACFARPIQVDHLDGRIVLRIASLADGTIATVESEPPAGPEGLAQVAGCLSSVARRLWLPWPMAGRQVTLVVSFVADDGATK